MLLIMLLRFPLCCFGNLFVITFFPYVSSKENHCAHSQELFCLFVSCFRNEEFLTQILEGLSARKG